MKKRCLVVLHILPLILFLCTSPLWLVIWFFTGFNVLKFWYDNFKKSKINKNKHYCIFCGQSSCYGGCLFYEESTR